MNKQDKTSESDSTRFVALLNEDKYLIEAFRYDDGETLSGNLISRTYQQENGKLCYTISTKSKTDKGDRIIYRAENMNDESHIEALLIVGKNIYTRYGQGHGLSYKLLTYFEKAWIKIICGIIIGIVISKLIL